MDMDFEEGYCDGLAGAGCQGRYAAAKIIDEFRAASEYHDGFEQGSLDRKTMLTPKRDAFDVWAEGMGDGDA
jgi:hypothetical protein